MYVPAATVGNGAADTRRGGRSRQFRTGLGGIGGLQEDARSRGESVTGDLQRLVQLDRSGQHDTRHRVLRSLQAHLSQFPTAVLLHDDGVHAGREGRRNRTFDPRSRHGLVFGSGLRARSIAQEELRRSLESLARHRIKTTDLGRGGNRIFRNRTGRLLVVISVRAGCECTRRASDQQHKP